MDKQLSPTDLTALAGRLEKGAAGLEGMLSSSCVAPDLRAAARCVRELSYLRAEYPIICRVVLAAVEAEVPR